MSLPRSVRSSAAAALVAAVALCGGTLCAGCATTDSAEGARLYRSGRYDAARAVFEQRLREEPANVALDRNEAGVMALLGGDLDVAHRHFAAAFTELDDLSSSTAETVGATVGSASSRRFKGEPYERCMNAWYLGVTNWLRGDVDNAAAAFKAGVLRDADSRHGAAQSDFAALWYALGQAQRAAAHSDRGAAATARAALLLPKNRALDERGDRGSVVVLAETGSGPRKVAAGPSGAWLRFTDGGARTGLVPRVSLGGRELGRAESLGTVLHQAQTRGEKVIDHVNQGKAVFKEAVKVAGGVTVARARTDEERLAGVGAIVLGSLIPAGADVRQWTSLPGELHGLTLDLPPGRHVLDVEFVDASGRADPSLTQRVPVEVRPGRVALAWARAPSGYVVPRF